MIKQSIIFSILLISVFSNGQSPIMVKDIKPGSTNGIYLSTPTPFGNQPPKVYVSDIDSILNGVIFKSYDSHLWYSDGTPGNTFDISPNLINSNSFLEFNNKIFFSGSDTINGVELWVSNGTAGGSSLFMDVYPGKKSSSAGYMGFYKTKTKFYFFAEDSLNGAELYVSDGTATGTFMLKDINPGTGDAFSWGLGAYTISGDSIYFLADDGVNGYELWFTDGTSANTKFIKDVNPGPGNSLGGFFTTIGNLTYFMGNTTSEAAELWVTDGTTAGTFILKDINPGPNSGFRGFYCVLNNLVIFKGYDPWNGEELWRTDGTTGGTYMIKDVTPGSGDTYYYDNYNIRKLNNKIYFGASNISYITIWETDGTLPNTTSSNGSQFPLGTTYIATMPFELNSKTYFGLTVSTTPNDFYYLYEINGSVTNTPLIKQITLPSTLNPDFYSFISTPAGKGFLHSTYNNIISDGTNLGTTLVNTEITYDSFQSFLGNNLICFSRSPITNSFVPSVFDVNTGNIVRFNDTLNNWPNNYPNGTVQNGWDFGSYKRLGNKIYFVAGNANTGFELMESDGSMSGTVFHDINPGSGSSLTQTAYYPNVKYNIYKPMITKNKLFFFANDGSSGLELWSLQNSSIGINEVSKNEESNLTIYPNPANSILNIRSEVVLGKNMISVTDILGKTIIETKNNDPYQTSINIEQLSSGVYLLQARSEKGLIVKKFIKE